MVGQVGFRLGRYLPDIVPQMLTSIDHEAPEADEQATNDLREICFQVREGLLWVLLGLVFAGVACRWYAPWWAPAGRHQWLLSPRPAVHVLLLFWFIRRTVPPPSPSLVPARRSSRLCCGAPLRSRTSCP